MIIQNNNKPVLPGSTWHDKIHNRNVIVTTALDTIAFRLEDDSKNNIYFRSREEWAQTFNYVKG